MRNVRWMFLACLMAVPVAGRAHATPMQEEPKPKIIVGCRETKLYHRADCKWVKEIDKAGTRVEFKSVEEARKAGMKPCGDCKP
jgi:hypothetical protein